MLIFLAILMQSQLATVTFAQEDDFQVRLYNIENGLGNNNIYDLKFDSEGVLWLATAIGISRFKEGQFTNFDDPLFRKFSHLEIDKHGNLWLKIQEYNTLVDDDNILVFEVEAGEWTTVPEYLAKTASLLDPSLIEAIWGDSEGNIYLLDKGNRIYQYNGEEMRLVREMVSDERCSPYAFIPNSLTLQRQNNYFTHVDLTSSSEETVKVAKPSDAMIWLKPGNFIIMRHNDLPIYQPDGRATASLDLRNMDGEILMSGIPRFYDLEYNGRQILSAGKNNTNVKVLSLADNRITDIWPAITRRFNNIYVFCATLDNAGNVWIGSSRGLIFTRQVRKKFTSYLTDRMISTRAMEYVGNDSLLISTYRGAMILDLQTRKTHHFLIGMPLFGISPIDKNTYAMGLHGNMVHVINVRNQSVIQSYPAEQGESPKPPACLQPYYSPDGRLFVGTDIGLYQLNPASQRLEKAAFDNGAFQYLTSGYHPNPESDKLWLLSQRGLWTWDVTGNKISGNLLKEYNIRYMHEDADSAHIFWIATSNHGLLRWDRRRSEIRIIDKTKGLTDNTVHAVHEDDRNRLWLPTNFGLNVLDKQTGEIFHLFETDGLPENEFNGSSSVRLPDGSLVLGSVNGIVKFHPDSINTIDYQKDIRLISCTAIRKSNGVHETLALGSPISIPYQYAGIALTFALSNTRFGEWRKLRYKLDDTRADWNYSEDNTLQIERLAFGRHYIFVSGKTPDGRWSETTAIQVWYVKPLFLRRAFLASVGFLIGLLVVYLLMRSRDRIKQRNIRLRAEIERHVSEVKQKNHELEGLNEIKDRLFAIIAHDLRGPALSLNQLTNKLKYLIAKGDTERVLQLSASVDKSAEKLTNLLDSLLAWSLQQKNMPSLQKETLMVHELVSEVVDFLKDDAVAKRMVFDISGDLEAHAMVNRNAGIVILRNLVQNSIKYASENTRVWIHISEEPECTRIVMKDNGPGIPQSTIQKLNSYQATASRIRSLGKHGVGIGLIICKMLTEQIGGRLKIHNNQDGGACITLSFPREELLAEQYALN